MPIAISQRKEVNRMNELKLEVEALEERIAPTPMPGGFADVFNAAANSGNVQSTGASALVGLFGGATANQVGATAVAPAVAAQQVATGSVATNALTVNQFTTTIGASPNTTVDITPTINLNNLFGP
jgi:hypothetical protein